MIFDIVAALVIFYYVLPVLFAALVWIAMLLIEKPVETLGVLIVVAVILCGMLG